MTTEKLTLDKVLPLAEAVVAEKGADFVYEPPTSDIYDEAKCVYVYNGAPSCIVGQILHRLGTPVEKMADWDDGGGYSAHALGDTGLVSMDLDTRSFLESIQHDQDKQVPYGEALTKAKKMMGL